MRGRWPRGPLAALVAGALGAVGALGMPAFAAITPAPVPAGVAGTGGTDPSPAASGSTSPNDPLFPRQWNLTKVGAPAAWTRAMGQGVLIGIVDTGIDFQHEDLAGKVVASTSCVGSNGQVAACTGTAQDDNGHGTHVAGIAAAVTGNGRGIAGTAPDARLVIAKSLDAEGNGSMNDVNAGIEWVVDHGARVVNLSLGSDMPALSGILGNDSISPGIEYAWAHGAIPVLAAGNENFFGLGSSNYGDADAVIVGSTGPNDEVAPYSSPMGNAKWALVAPGGDGQDGSGNPSCSGAAASSCIVSAWWTATNPTTAYAYDQGTSMATPMVSGALALLLSRGLSPSEAVSTLLSTADRAVSCGSGCAGRLDLARAVDATGTVSPLGTASTGSPGTAAPSASATPTSSPTSVGAPPPPVGPSPAGAEYVAGGLSPGSSVAGRSGQSGERVSAAPGPPVAAAPRPGVPGITASTRDATPALGAVAAVLLAAVAGASAWVRRRPPATGPV